MKMSNDIRGDYNENTIRIEDLDLPIYRIFRLWNFEKALQLKQLVLVAPRLWEDPYQRQPWQIQVQKHGPPYEHAITENFMHPVFAQCWSATPESDTLLRAYSRVLKDAISSRNTCPAEEGVTVRSSPRKLLEALAGSKWANPSECCFVGKVQYFEAGEIHRGFANTIAREIPRTKFSQRQVAEALLIKRSAFSHEDEVRLIYVEAREKPCADLVRFQIDPNDVFDDVRFDPRLVMFERKEREERAKKLGYGRAFSESELYRTVLLDIWLD